MRTYVYWPILSSFVALPKQSQKREAKGREKTRNKEKKIKEKERSKKQK
jgi:hypothetical protein